MQKGSVEITAAGRVAVLAAGDAVTFRGDADHGYANAGRGTARFSLTVFEPNVLPGTTSHGPAGGSGARPIP